MQRHKQSGSAIVVRGGARWSADDAQRILDEWATSGESLHAFAQRRGVVPQRLWWWQKRLGGKPGVRVTAAAAIATPPAFLPVTVRPVESEPAKATVETANGLRIELRVLDSASAAWIASLVKALGAAS
jgi:hypothetical protein